MQKKLLLLPALLLMVLCQLASAKTSPIEVLDTAAKNVLGALAKNRDQIKTDPQRVTKIVYRYLLPHVDIRGMSRSVLGRTTWQNATATQKKQFTEEFTRLVVNTYATPLTQYSNEKIVFHKPRTPITGRRAIIHSTLVRQNGPDIPISYRLIFLDGAWKVYDMSVEGVSLLQSYRSQFSSALRKADLQTLIQKLSTHNNKVTS